MRRIKDCLPSIKWFPSQPRNLVLCCARGFVAILLLNSMFMLLGNNHVFAGSHSITTGLSFSYDDEQRDYQEGQREDDYRRLAATPLVHYIFQANAVDNFEIRALPSIVYDLDENETDLDLNLLLAFHKSLSRDWAFTGSNSLVRSDSQDTIESDDTAVESPASAPELSADAGRTRYWRNDLQLGVDYTYKQASLIHLGFGYNLLRNDDSGEDGYQDYDRYVFSLQNTHQYSSQWMTILDLSFVRGEYDETDFDDVLEDAPATDTDLEDDVNEYRAGVTLVNTSFRQNTISVNYEYIGAKYDDRLQDDSDIHQGQLTWLHQYSEQFSTTLGAGPSYQKTEGLDANTGVNGIVALNYRTRRASVDFEITKDYDVENFSGTDRRGFVDIWDAGLTVNYDLTRDLSVNADLSYTNEKREQPVIEVDEATSEILESSEEYENNIYSAGLGLSYRFMRFYSAGIDYTYSKQESDRIEDEYDDHRLLITLSWEQEWLRW